MGRKVPQELKKKTLHERMLPKSFFFFFVKSTSSHGTCLIIPSRRMVLYPKHWSDIPPDKQENNPMIFKNHD